MRGAGLLAVCCCLVLGSAGFAAAQPLPPEAAPPAQFDIGPLTPEQDRDLTAWLAATEKWQRYDLKWQNRPARDGWARIVARQPVPDAPGWLEHECAIRKSAGVLELEQRIADGCRLLADPRASIAGGYAQAQAAKLAEAPAKHSSFLTRMHIDGLWTTAETTGRIYGLVGSHFSLVDVGRVQVFGPPGVILLSVPAMDGGRQVTLGYTWGVSVRLSDMRLGDRDMTLFLNVSKVWVNAQSETPNAQGFEAIGFSLAPRKKR